MATLSELAVRLQTRFREVPNVDIEDTTAWMEWSLLEHGYRLDQNVPTNALPLVLLYAEADGTSQIALRTAFYFEYRDGEEAVDKSMISDQYKSISEKLWERYYRKKSEGTDGAGGSQVAFMQRRDRP
jgi:hypothetical protein